MNTTNEITPDLAETVSTSLGEWTSRIATLQALAEAKDRLKARLAETAYAESRLIEHLR